MQVSPPPPSSSPPSLPLLIILLLLLVTLWKGGGPPYGSWRIFMIALIIAGLSLDYFLPTNQLEWLAEYTRPLTSHGGGLGVALVLLLILSAHKSLASVLGVEASDRLLEMVALQCTILLFTLCGIIMKSSIFIILNFIALSIIGMAFLSFTGNISSISKVILPSVIMIWLLCKLPKAFSLGEAVICSVIISETVIASIPLLGLVESNTFTLLPSQFCRISVSLVFASLLTLAICSIGLSSGNKVKAQTTSPLTIISIFGIFTGFLIVQSGALTRPRALIREFLYPNRIRLCIHWLAILLLTFSATGFYLAFKPANPSKLQKHFARKFYHAMAVLLFVPATIQDISFLRASFAIATSIFIILEMLRLFATESLVSLALTFGIEAFRDRLDPSPAILSHLWLLLGCAIPVFISSDSFKPGEKLQALTGTLSLGLMDGVAAIVGLLFGGPRWWFHLEKTLMGSIAGLLAHLISQIFILTFYYKDMAAVSWISLILQTTICSIWEASSDQNDNLTLPIIAFISAVVFSF